MGSCIICGTSVDGRICDIHEEDVVFEFRGSHPNQLSTGRYYRGTVDGFAEFGVFVDIGDSVTGLLHRSELDRRLEALDWDPGDVVYVQVQNVRDNGNVDLGWSIRQSDSEFRGTLIDDPESDEPIREKETGESDEPDSTAGSDGDAARIEPEPVDGTSSEDSEERVERTESTEPESESSAEDGEATEPESTTIDRLDDMVGSQVRIEGEVVTARQTSGPTVFEVRDETDSVECAAFEAAGVRAYPDVEEGDVVRIDGEVERRRGDLQVETEALVVLDDAEERAFVERMEEALVQRARPTESDPLVDDPVVEQTSESLVDGATAIRRAVFEGRPIVVRHSASVDGYVAATAIERATLPLIAENQRDADAEYHYFDRRPLQGAVYDMDDATGDVTSMLSNRARHGEKLPLFVFVAAGGTAESLDAFDLLDIYGVRRVVVDEDEVAGEVADAVDVLVTPDATGADTTATVLASNLAALVNEDVREDLTHLPAISFWEEPPEAYVTLAEDAGYDAAAIEQVRNAIALEAYYQSYEDKRELVIDLLFAEETEDPAGLASHVSEQYETRMDAAVETAEANLEAVEGEAGTIHVLDTDAYTHRYEFPPAELLLDELARRHRDDATALLGLGTDTAYVRTDADVDLGAVIERARESAPAAGIDGRGVREGRIEFLAGEREAVRGTLLDALEAELSSVAPA